MMTLFTVIAKVDQITTRDVQVLVEADSEEEAQGKVREVMQIHPQSSEVVGVRKVLVTRQNYWMPRDIEIIRTRKEKSG
jgi:hypothetical protein